MTNELYGTLLLTALLLPISTPSLAETSKFSINVGPNIELANGTPANDLIGFRMGGHYRWKPGLMLGIALDIYEYDFEKPTKAVSIVQDESKGVIDAATTSTNITAWLQKSILASKDNLYWKAGFGIGIVSIDDVTGPVRGGGTFNITTEPGNEFIVLAGLGYRYDFSKNIAIKLETDLNQHFANWKVKDKITGNTGSVDDYTSYGFRLGFSYQF